MLDRFNGRRPPTDRHHQEDSSVAESCQGQQAYHDQVPVPVEHVHPH